MQKFIVLAIAALAVCSTLNVEDDYARFQSFIKKYGKQYDSVEEYMARFSIFKRRVNKLKAHKTWTETITQFSDLTIQEFRKQYANLDVRAFTGAKFNPVKPVKGAANDDYFNYVDQGYLGPVKNQGSCGSCYAFSAIGNLEGLYFGKTHQNVELSEQMIVDCDTYDAGCNGGLMELTWTWIQENGGINTQADYPYEGRERNCRSNPSGYVQDLHVTGWNKLGDKQETWDPQNQGEIKDWLVSNGGPVSIALNADALMSYGSGIIDADEYECDPEGINHGVILVGYGTENGVDYWIVRNSWGASWGEKGYFRIKRDDSSSQAVCGMNVYITSATIE